MKWHNTSTVSHNTSTSSQNTRGVNLNIDERGHDVRGTNPEVTITVAFGGQIKIQVIH